MPGKEMLCEGVDWIPVAHRGVYIDGILKTR
jgi:hypothetical protein